MDDMLRRTIGDSIDMETVVSGGLWNTLVDPAQLENVLLNLAINARDAMDGVGKLTIEVGNSHLDDSYALEHPDVKAGQYVVLTVSDTDVVMRTEKITRVAWSRVDAIDVDQLGGTYDVMRGQRVTDDERRKLSLISRFPQGISPLGHVLCLEPDEGEAGYNGFEFGQGVFEGFLWRVGGREVGVSLHGSDVALPKDDEVGVGALLEHELHLCGPAWEKRFAVAASGGPGEV